MYKVQFDIIHEGCWGSEISLKFPRINFLLVDTRWVKEDIAEILLISGEELYFDKEYDLQLVTS